MHHNLSADKRPSRFSADQIETAIREKLTGRPFFTEPVLDVAKMEGFHDPFSVYIEGDKTGCDSPIRLFMKIRPPRRKRSHPEVRVDMNIYSKEIVSTAKCAVMEALESLKDLI